MIKNEVIELSSKTTSQNMTHIFHIADIHIRNGDIERSRFEEYQQALQHMITCLDDHPSVAQKSALVVIAGDLFHHKGRMDTPALKLYFGWMDQLLARAPVLMICGNHDFRQEDPRHPDMLETMVLPYKNQRKMRHPLYYLRETGHYIYADIGFAVMSIKETLRTYATSGQVDKLPTFPSPHVWDDLEGDCVRHRLALFHGSVCQSALPNEHRLSDMQGYPLEWFAGYDAVLLGDNHKQQYHPRSADGKVGAWAYPGSLVQQDFGEPTWGHGYVLWDLTADQPHGSLHHIQNPYGLITVKWSEKHNAYGVLWGRRDWEPIADAVTRDAFPLYPRVRILGTVGEDTKVRQELETLGIRPANMLIVTSLDENGGLGEEDVDSAACAQRWVQLADLNAPEQWIQYLAKVGPELQVSEWIQHPVRMKMELKEGMQRFLPPDLMQKITDRNQRIQAALDAYHEEMSTQRKGYRIVFKHMGWDYAMCYGQNNHFDFQQIAGTIALLNGRNATGKSSFLDVLCIGLYGEPTKHRNMMSGKKMTAKMIHDQRPANKSVMRVNLLFEMNGEEYEITRAFTTQRKEEHGVYAQLHQAMVSKVAEDRTTKVIVCEGATMVDPWVEQHFGTLEDMLMSTIVCQLDMTNFFYMKQEEQKKILDHALQLGSIAAFGKILKEVLLAHQDWISLLRTSLQSVQNGQDAWVADAHIEEMQTRLQKQREHEKELQQRCEDYRTAVGAIENLQACIEDYPNPKMLQKYQTSIETTLKGFEEVNDTISEEVLLSKGGLLLRHETCVREKEESWNHVQQCISNMKNGEHEDNDSKDESGEHCERAEEGKPREEMLDATACRRRWDAWEKDCEDHMEQKQLPEVSQAKLVEIRTDLERWRTKYPFEWTDDPDMVLCAIEEQRLEVERLRHQWKQHEEDAAAMRPEGAEPQVQVTLQPKAFQQFHREHVECVERIRALRAQEGIRPVRDQEEYSDWLRQWEAWVEKTHDIYSASSLEELQEEMESYEAFYQQRKKRGEEQQQVLRDVEAYEEELQQLTTIPFNADCWACQKNPSHIRKTQIDKSQARAKKLLQRVQAYLVQCEEHGNLSEMKEELQRMKQKCERRRYYDTHADRMLEEKRQWTLAKKQWKEKAVWEASLQEAEEKRAVFHGKLVSHSWAQWNAWKKTQHMLESHLAQEEVVLHRMEMFLAEYDAREKDIVLLQEEELRWKHWDTWEGVRVKLDAEGVYLRAVQRYHDKVTQLAEVGREVEALGKDLDRVYQKRKWQAQWDLCERVRVYYAWQKEKDAWNVARKDVETTQSQCVLLEHTLRDQASRQERIEVMEALLEDWVDRKARIHSLEVKFMGDKQNGDGYKEWIYRDRVAPLVEEEVNRFLASLESFRLKIVYDRKCFLYFLEDRGNLPTLDKASGYQNFVVGLAMRLALARIGAVGQNIRHLFIDEGFTACDVANIEKVPQLLRSLMTCGGYESILLMSHLEQVQEAAQVKVDIMRQGMFSFVRWGTEYPGIRVQKTETPLSSDTIVRKRGRPVRNKASTSS